MGDLAKELEDAVADNTMPAAEMIKTIPEMSGEAEATRVSGYKVIQDISKLVPNYISGSADLHGSTRNYIDGAGNFGAGFDKSYAGKNLYFGIREHAMGAILNGIAYHGIFKASGSTFLVFVDYFRPTIRVASLAELNRVSYILTHDSIGVGKDGPTALILSRQNLDQNTDMPAMERREGSLKGAYIAKKESGDLDLIIIATGSEVQHALAAAKDMAGARVVSMPCMELYERQSDDYKESVLPSTCTKRIAMEAGVSAPWYKYASKVVGVDRFGFSAPGDIVMAELGMTAENLAAEISTMN